MPAYELSVIFKVMQKPEFVTALKRTAETIWSRGGLLRKLENLGTRALPYKMNSHGNIYKKGSYFLFHFDSPTAAIPEYMEFLGRDVDVIKRMVVKQEDHKPVNCTLEEELQPPPYRKDVQKLLEEGKRTKRPLFKPYVLEITTKPF